MHSSLAKSSSKNYPALKFVVNLQKVAFGEIGGASFVENLPVLKGAAPALLHKSGMPDLEKRVFNFIYAHRWGLFVDAVVDMLLPSVHAFHNHLSTALSDALEETRNSVDYEQLMKQMNAILNEFGKVESYAAHHLHRLEVLIDHHYTHVKRMAQRKRKATEVCKEIPAQVVELDKYVKEHFTPKLAELVLKVKIQQGALLAEVEKQKAKKQRWRDRCQFERNMNVQCNHKRIKLNKKLMRALGTTDTNVL